MLVKILVCKILGYLLEEYGRNIICHLKIRFVVFSSRKKEPFTSKEVVEHVSSPCFYSSREQTNQTLALNMAFHVFHNFFSHHRFLNNPVVKMCSLYTDFGLAMLAVGGKAK